jgi:hypothetical protein
MIKKFKRKEFSDIVDDGSFTKYIQYNREHVPDSRLHQTGKPAEYLSPTSSSAQPE